MGVPKRFIWLVIVLVVLLGGAVTVTKYLNSFQKLDVTLATSSSSGLKVGIYRAFDYHEANPQAFIKPQNLARTVDQHETLKLKKGTYVVSSQGNNDYAAQVEVVHLGSTSQSVVINPDYSAAKLSSLLNQDLPDITKKIQAAFPAANQYDIARGKLYQHGEWYGTTLVVKETAEQRRTSYTDTYRLVAHKDGGSWQIVSQPPDLIISHVVYPNVPRNILVDINKLTP